MVSDGAGVSERLGGPIDASNWIEQFNDARAANSTEVQTDLTRYQRAQLLLPLVRGHMRHDCTYRNRQPILDVPSLHLSHPPQSCKRLPFGGNGLCPAAHI
jgi:hypothetical protein